MIKFKSSKQCEYFITESGIVFSRQKNNGKLIKIKPRKHKGYLLFKNTGIHLIVGRTFIPNTENKKMINHKDGNKENNHKDNLEWATAYENNNHAFATGLNNSKKLSDQDVLMIVEEYRTGNYSSKDLSIKWGVCDRMIMAFALGKERKHLNIIPCTEKKAPGRIRMYNEETVAIIKSMVSNGFTRKDIAQKTGMSKGQVQHVLAFY